MAFVAMFVVCFGIVWLLVRSAHRAADSDTRTTASLGGAADSTAHLSDSAHRTSAPAAHLAGRTIALPPRTARFFAAAGRLTVRATRNWRRIWLVIAIGWLWIPTTLLVAYGADILSQTREFAWAWNQWTGLEQPYIGFFSFVPMDIYPTPTTLLVAYGADILSQTREFAWAWNQWTGLEQPYIGFFSFVPMDIYPTAHYMWSTDPTYLTDQHNIVLTVIYGASAALSRYLTGSNDAGFVVLAALQWLFAGFCCALTDQHNIVLTVIYGASAALSRYLTGSNDAGFVVLAALQWLFAGFCCASAANRFFNLPWIPRTASAPHTHPDYAHPERLRTATPIDFAHPERGPRIHTLTAHTPAPAGPLARVLVMLLFLCCPLVTFSTISLTKSPLFAFAFTWWFGLMYELYMTHRNAPARPQRTRPVTIAALVVSCVVMLVSAKYAWYILMIQVVLSLLADRRRWRLYLLTLLLPTVLVHGAIAMLISSGAIIGGDPIESRGAQLQMIARVAQRTPGAIPESAARKLAPIFNIDQMAQAYRSEDADPVKSSLLADRRRWRLYLLTLLLPTVLVHGAIAMLIGSGAIIGGDPIESRGAQLQMIARVAQRNPGAIPESAARPLAPIFNLDQLAQAYLSEDADPVNSSGIQSKKVSYRWRSVTAEDMKQFNAAWLEIVRAYPQTAFDALFAREIIRLFRRVRPAIRADELLRGQRLRAAVQHMDQTLQSRLARRRGACGAPVEPDSGARLGHARQFLRHAHVAHRGRRARAAPLARAELAYAAPAVDGRHDHGAGEQFRAPHAADRVRLRIPVYHVRARQPRRQLGARPGARHSARFAPRITLGVAHAADRDRRVQHERVARVGRIPAGRLGGAFEPVAHGVGVDVELFRRQFQ